MRFICIWHRSIRADKPPNHWVIVPGIEVVQACSIKALAGELLIGGHRAGPGAAEGEVLHGSFHLGAAAVGDQRRAGEVVLMKQMDHKVGYHRMRSIYQ